MGCRLNAYTSREQTVYYANVLKKDVGASLGILSEMLLHRYLLSVFVYIHTHMYLCVYRHIYLYIRSAFSLRC